MHYTVVICWWKKQSRQLLLNPEIETLYHFWHQCPCCPKRIWFFIEYTSLQNSVTRRGNKSDISILCSTNGSKIKKLEVLVVNTKLGKWNTSSNKTTLKCELCRFNVIAFLVQHRPSLGICLFTKFTLFGLLCYFVFNKPKRTVLLSYIFFSQFTFRFALIYRL